MGRKLGALSPFGGGELGLGPHLTQRRWAEAYVNAKYHLDPCSHLAAEDMGRKFGGCTPLVEGSWVPIQYNVAMAEAYMRAKFHLDPSNRFATVHQRHRQTDRTTADSI